MTKIVISKNTNAIELCSSKNCVRAFGDPSIIIARTVGIALILIAVIGSIYYFKTRYA